MSWTSKYQQSFGYISCKEWLKDIRLLHDKLVDDKNLCAGKETAIASYINKRLRDIEFAIMGRMAELNENYCVEYETRYGFSGFFNEYAKMARDNGVNFVAVWRYCLLGEMADVIQYLKDSGQATLDYEKTCKAVEQYFAIKTIG